MTPGKHPDRQSRRSRPLEVLVCGERVLVTANEAPGRLDELVQAVQDTYRDVTQLYPTWPANRRMALVCLSLAHELRRATREAGQRSSGEALDRVRALIRLVDEGTDPTP